MDSLELQAAPRTIVGKQVKQLRREGLTPGVLYGTGVGSLALKFDARELERLVARAGSSTLISVFVAGTKAPYNAIIRDVQRDLLKQYVTHVDLQALSMTETVRVPISLVLTSVSPAVQEQGGVLLQIVSVVEAECLPAALVPSIEIDISALVEIGQSLSVRDIVIPEGIELLTDPDEIIVQVTAVEEEKAVEGVVATTEVEVIGRPVKEEPAD